MMTSSNVVILSTQLESTLYEAFKARIRGLRAEWTETPADEKNIKFDTTIHCSDARAELEILQPAIDRAHLFNDEVDEIIINKAGSLFLAF